MKLYEIDNLIENVLQTEIDPETGEITEHGMTLLGDLEIEREKKFMGLVYAYKNIDSDSEAIKAEIDRLREKKKIKDNKAESIKRFLKANVPEGEKIEDGVAKIGWRKSKSVSVENIDILPTEYTKITVEAKKSDIKKAIESGKEIVGCSIKESMNIQIK